MSKAFAVFFCPRTHWQHLRNLTDWTFLTLVVLYGFVFQNARTIIQTLSMSVIPNSGKSPSVHLSVGCHHSWLSKMVSILVSLVTQFTVSDRAVSRFRFLYRGFPFRAKSTWSCFEYCVDFPWQMWFHKNCLACLPSVTRQWKWWRGSSEHLD